MFALVAKIVCEMCSNLYVHRVRPANAFALSFETNQLFGMGESFDCFDSSLFRKVAQTFVTVTSSRLCMNCAQASERSVVFLTAHAYAKWTLNLNTCAAACDLG